MKGGLPIVLDDDQAERCNRNHADRIDELQVLPFAGAIIVPNIKLVDSVVTPIAHKLGRIPKWVGVSVIRGATATGRIVENQLGVDLVRLVSLTATGHGATITVDLVLL